MIKIESELSIDAQKKMVLRSTKKIKIIIYGLTLVWFVFGVASCVFAFIDKQEIPFSTIINMIVCIVFPIAFNIAYSLAIKKQFTSNPIFKRKFKVIFDFDESFFTTQTIENNEQIASSKFEYSHIVKIEELNQYLYIYIANALAFIIDKKDITDLTSEQFEKFIEIKTGKKIIRIKTKK